MQTDFEFRHVLLHASLIPKVSPVILHGLIEHFSDHEIMQWYSYTVADFIKVGIDQETAHALVVGLSNRLMLEKELQLIQQYHASWITIKDEVYPELLKEIHLPPIILYYQGDLTLFKYSKKLACVGARKANLYTKQALDAIVGPLVEDGWCIVSGGALGADTFAHQMVINQKGLTIVVVGSGLMHTYPPHNKKMFEEIVRSKGLIVSCFAMSTEPMAWCFPVRNRIIAGLSLGCLVLQAASKSGALITAQYALDQGRQVFALPGSIFDPLSAGCHNLIQQGASLVQSSSDILQEFSYLVSQKDRKSQRKLFVPAEASIKDLAPVDSLAAQILDACSIPMNADQLMNLLQIELSVLQSKLFDLSLDHKIMQDALGFWQKV